MTDQERMATAIEGAAIFRRSGREGLAAWLNAAGDDQQLRFARKDAAFPYMYGEQRLPHLVRSALDNSAASN